jgi:peroxin-2
LVYVQSDKIKEKTPPTTNQRILQYVLSLLFPYLVSKINKYMMENGWSEESNGIKKKVWNAMNYLENVINLLSTLNFMIFLVKGEYRNIVDRIVGMRLAYDHTSTNKIIDFDYMNQEIVWSKSKSLTKTDFLR